MPNIQRLQPIFEKKSDERPSPQLLKRREIIRSAAHLARNIHYSALASVSMLFLAVHMSAAVDPLANDNFINRLLIFGTPDHVTGANAGATTESGEPFQGGANRWGETLWWKWIAPVSGTVTIDTIGSDYNTFLGVYVGAAVNALTVVAQNDNASLTGVGASSVTFSADEGTEYQIQVGGVFTGGFGGIPTKGNIQLNVALLPYVTIASPVAGSVVPIGSNITINVNAFSIAGPITNVSLYRGAMLLGGVTNASYSFVVSNAPAGTNVFYAAATDSIGEMGTSAVVRVLVATVGITITSPAHGAILQGTAPIAISAFPMLPSGSITRVNFFVDGQLIGQDFAAPFTVTWNSVASGTHRLTANALDNSGNTYYATPVSVSVTRSFFPAHSVWKYLDNGSNQNTNWYASTFDDNSWTNGPAELGYGDGDEVTRVEDNATPGYNASDTVRYMTTYFRRAFVVTNVASYSHVRLNVKCDDGAVIYLNGREAARFNMNTGIVNCLTPARFAGDDGATFVPTTAPASFLVEGTNIIAVEIHQATADSTDISFDMDLAGIPTTILPLRIDSITLAQTNVVLAFRAEANVSYTLEHATAVDDWQTLQPISAAPTNRTIQVTRPASDLARFYRLRLP